MSTKEKGLVAVKKISIFERAFNFLRGMFYKEKTSEHIMTVDNKDSYGSFSEIALSRIDKEEMLKLIKIQDEIERRGISEIVVAELTKELTQDEKNNLEELYKIQIIEKDNQFK